MGCQCLNAYAHLFRRYCSEVLEWLCTVNFSGVLLEAADIQWLASVQECTGAFYDLQAADTMSRFCLHECAALSTITTNA